MKQTKVINTILTITKYAFIIFIILFTILFISLLIYSKKVSYYMPSFTNIEIYDNNNELIVKNTASSSNSYVPIEEINPNIINAFLSIEDKDFYKHQGINLKRIIGALIHNIKDKEYSQGGSTITQQYVKNTFLGPEKTIKRKLQEALISINIESKYSKNEILEGYLNSIYFDHGITGINDACLFYFNKHPSEISLNEACVIASIPKSPSNYSPIKNYENNNKRRMITLNELLKDNKISKAEYDSTINEYPDIYGIFDKAKISNCPFYIDIIMKEYKKMNINDKNGVKIYTYLDKEINSLIEKAIEKYYDNENGIELALVAMKTNGEVIANVGGKSYIESTYNRTFSSRQPGSTIKPFLYYAALNHGFNVSSTFYSGPTTFYYDNTAYSPSNYGNIYPNTNVSMAYAIATSDNIYAMKTHLFLGTDTLYKTLKDFGFTSKLNNNPSLALGTSEVTLSELTSGYTKIASLGVDIKPRYINRITDSKENTLYTTKENNNQVFNSTTCYLLSEALTNVFDSNLRISISPTCSSISQFLHSTYAGKSGSTDFDGLMIGYNKDMVLGIWTGYDDNRVLLNSETKYIKYIWAYVMDNYNRYKENTWYETPNDVIAIRLNPINGQLGNLNEYQKYLYYNINNLPQIL